MPFPDGRGGDTYVNQVTSAVGKEKKNCWAKNKLYLEKVDGTEGKL